MKLESMSKNVVSIVSEIAKMQVIMRLVANDTDNPYIREITKAEIKELTNPKSPTARVLPYPFDPEATIEDNSSIRVYYNGGSFDGTEVIATSQLHIDIICAKSLWLVHDDHSSMIRPYEIMSHLVNHLGRKGLSRTIRLNMKAFRHFSVNTQFECIRLYCEYTSIET